MKSLDNKMRISLVKNDGSSNFVEMRPIRDKNFQNKAKSKINNLLDLTEYKKDTNANIFKNITTSELKAVFEHFIRQMCKTFCLNESKETWEQCIMNFFSIFKYKSNFSLAHMRTPTLASSSTFVIAALDFIRRLVQAHMNNHPEMMFPRFEEIDLSTEFVLVSIIKMKHEFDTKSCYNMKDAFKEFNVTIRKRVGVMTEEEKHEKKQRLFDIETVLRNNVDILHKIENVNESNQRLEQDIEECANLLRQKKIAQEIVTLEIASFEKCNKSILEEKFKVENAVNRFATLGYDDTLSSLNEAKSRLKTVQTNCLNWKIKEDNLKKDIKKVDAEIEKMKLYTHEELIGINSEKTKELKKMLTHLCVEDLLNFKINIRPIFHALSTDIGDENSARTTLYEERKCACEAEEQEYAALVKDIDRVKNRESKHKVALEKIQFELANIVNDADESYRERDDRYQILKDVRKESVGAEKEHIMLKATLAREQQETNDARDFFRADIEWRQFIAEQELKVIVNGYNIDKSIVDMRNDVLREDHDYVEKESARRKEEDAEMVELFSKELERMQHRM